MIKTEERDFEDEKKEEDKEMIKAEEIDFEDAKTKLAYYKLTGIGGVEIDVDEAVALLKERVEDKDSEAMWMLGLCYEYGMGCEQDLEKAELLYNKSCKRDNVIGIFLAENGKEGRGKGILRVETGL